MENADDFENPTLVGALQKVATDGLLLRLSSHLAYLLASTWDESDDTRNELRRAIEVSNVIADRLAPDEELYLCVPDE